MKIYRVWLIRVLPGCSGDDTKGCPRSSRRAKFLFNVSAMPTMLVVSRLWDRTRVWLYCEPSTNFVELETTDTIEMRTFDNEIVALRIDIEMIEGLRYKLRMMDVPIDGACKMFCDNDSVVKNISRPESPWGRSLIPVVTARLKRASLVNGLSWPRSSGTQTYLIFLLSWWLDRDWDYVIMWLCACGDEIPKRDRLAL